MRSPLIPFRWLVSLLLLAVSVAIATAQSSTRDVAAGGRGGARGGAPNPAAAPAIELPGIAGQNAFAAGKPLQPPHEKAALIRLNAPVDEMMLKSLNRRLDIARKAGCTLVIYEIDTYGGLVTSALEISMLTKRLPDQHLNTVAWVHGPDSAGGAGKAYSAGSLISASCQQIVMAPGSFIGDCAPIMIAEDKLVPLPAAERAKAESPILTDFEDSAKRNGINPLILDAMVVTSLEVHEMHNTRTAETRFVDGAEREKLINEQADLPGGGKEKPWQYVRTIDTGDRLLTVGTEDALKMGLSKATIANPQELQAALNVRDLLVLDFNWAEVATVFLTQTWVRFFLFIGMLVFAWVEFSHPGISVAGIASVICLILLVGAPFLTGLAQVWEIALIILGLAIIVADVFAFGGVGMLAIPGFILMAIGLIASFVPAEPGGGWLPSMNSTWVALRTGLTVVVGGSFTALAAFFVLSRYLYLTPGFNRLQLVPGGGPPGGGGSRKQLAVEAMLRDAADRPAGDAVFVGALGIAASDLRPAGKARFDDHLVDVVSYGLFIERGTPITVTEIGGARVVVKPHTQPTLPTDQDSLPPPPADAPSPGESSVEGPGGSA